MSVMRQIPIALIDAGNRLRVLDPAWVRTLADDMAVEGQEEPIRVVERGDRFQLVSGARRLAAAGLLDWSEIDATIKPAGALVDEASARLAEIKADMMRGELTALDHAVYVSTWCDLWLRDVPNVTVLPKRSEVHTTPAIEAAIDAFEARTENRPYRAADDRVAEAQRRLVAEMDAEDAATIHRLADAAIEKRAADLEEARVAHLPATVIPLPESPKARYRRAVILERAIAAGEPVPAADAMLLERYRHSSEYRGERMLHEDFGDEYLAL
ncbi:ParB N-terminal domain-containing protein [uncultured Aureimonas sp.]|uniref:ParB N-terminal domain-containing protein n=1 Tax=uncultured Aureimonas sp. TaxID=1604662 RepID=UPI0025DFC7C4|nr:ParB N-terminal domain-containing protein [uncultured Aureimonas sp.]